MGIEQTKTVFSFSVKSKKGSAATSDLHSTIDEYSGLMEATLEGNAVSWKVLDEYQAEEIAIVRRLVNFRNSCEFDHSDVVLSSTESFDY